MLNVTGKNSGRVTVLNLEGQVMIGKTDKLRDAVQSLPQTSSVILDLSRVTLIDAHGIGVILQLREKSQAKGASFQLVNVNRPLRQVFQITHLDTVFGIDSGAEYVAQPLAA